MAAHSAGSGIEHTESYVGGWDLGDDKTKCGRACCRPKILGFIQAHLIAEKVIKERGGNKFLGFRGMPHVGIWQDFAVTDKGLTQKDEHILPPPAHLQA